MKKGIIIAFFLIFMILPFLAAQEEQDFSDVKSKAISCIQEKVEQKGCSSFGLEDKIFSVLSIGECKSDLISEAKNEECFGLNNVCNLKTTSQAVLALSNSGSNTESYEDWITAQSGDAPGIEWLIQIETPKAASCTIKDSGGNQYSVSLDDEKKVSMASGLCLSTDSTGYWLKINPSQSCKEYEFEISCDENFLTSLIFRKELSQDIYVLDESPETASAGGTTLVKQKTSSCFKQGNACNYEGTLWAVIALNNLDKDVSSYLHYLTAFKDDNKALLPEVVLYSLTGNADYRLELISKQKANRYWQEAHDKFYDTAFALLPLSAESTEAKDNSLNWLSEVQEGEGCWDSGNIAKTGFLVYSIWPTEFGAGGGTGIESCVDSGNYCISDISCSEAGGQVLDYSCSGLNVCCSKDKLAQTCSDVGGEICESSTEECNGYSDYSVSGLGADEICCLGSCQEKAPPSTDSCTQNGGVCRVGGCLSTEKEDFFYSCSFSDETCCLVKTEKKGGSAWIWILSILIILTIIGIIFREKLREFYSEFQEKFKRKPSKPQEREMPYHRMPPRRIIPSHGLPMQRRPVISGRTPEKKSELDEVLKKLKEMGR